jgi:dTDP-4-dehydrorhamnose 3,5-epimerase-like enzyme
MLDTSRLVVKIARFDDPRGSLIVAEHPGALPFVANRFFVVSGVPTGTSRGSHAHREQHQLLVAVQGTVAVDVTDGDEDGIVILDSPSIGMWIPPLIWATERYLTADAVLLVLASAPYEAAEYVTSLDEMRSLRAARS